MVCMIAVCTDRFLEVLVYVYCEVGSGVVEGRKLDGGATFGSLWNEPSPWLASSDRAVRSSFRRTRSSDRKL